MNVSVITSLPVDIYDLNEVLMAVCNLNKWTILGLQLGLSYHTLEKIDNDHHDRTDTCKMKMLVAWLRQEDDVSK